VVESPLLAKRVGRSKKGVLRKREVSLTECKVSLLGDDTVRLWQTGYISLSF